MWFRCVEIQRENFVLENGKGFGSMIEIRKLQQDHKALA